LFRADNEAIDVKWEIIYEQEDDVKQDDSEASMPLPGKSGIVNGPARGHAASNSVGEIGMWRACDCQYSVITSAGNYWNVVALNLSVNSQLMVNFDRVSEIWVCEFVTN